MSKNTPRVEINKDMCKGCELCNMECPKKVLSMSQDLNQFGYNYCVFNDNGGCIGCAMCFYACPEPEAIKVFKKETEKKS